MRLILHTEPQRLAQVERFCAAIRELGGDAAISVVVSESNRRMIATLTLAEVEDTDNGD